MSDMTRRDALRLTAGLSVAALGTVGCGGSPGSDRPAGNGELPRSTELMKPESRRELDSVRVLSATCTHARCTVAWQLSSRQFRCPCHRGTYDSDGTVVSGPPPRALDRLRVVVENGTVYLES